MTVVGNSATKEVDAAKALEAEAVNANKADKDMEKNKEGVFDDIGSPTQAPVDESTKDVEALSRLPGHVGDPVAARLKINSSQYDPSDLVITPEEKLAFIDAMISGSRYTQTFKLFGGKLVVTVRSRTADETHAMYAYIRHVLSGNDAAGFNAVEGDMAYVPLVAQIAEMNGTAFPEMKTPLLYTMSDGKEQEPGWYGDFKAWKAKPEGLTSALVSCIQLFEYKYWTMTMEASDKNFWNSDTSTEG